ncbi:hypothetical protein C8J56DRAFT_588192 [Mycena floridula]|nr:hypothetical protein C8J56DRAFT_588192 [Mycena floridula]
MNKHIERGSGSTIVSRLAGSYFVAWLFWTATGCSLDLPFHPFPLFVSFRSSSCHLRQFFPSGCFSAFFLAILILPSSCFHRIRDFCFLFR